MPDSLITKYVYDSIRSIDTSQSLNEGVEQNSFLGLSFQLWEFIISPLIIPMIIGFFGFFLGKGFSLYLEKKKLVEQYKEQQTYIAIWIKKIKDDVLNQANAYHEFSIVLKNLGVLGLKSYNLNLDKIKLIDSIQLVKIFISNRNGNQEELISLFYKFEKSIDLIIRRNESAFKLLEVIKEVTSEITNKWNLGIFDLRIKLQELTHSYTYLKDPNIGIEILDLFNSYNFERKEGMEFFMNFFGEKCGIICSEYFNKYPDDKVIQELLNILTMLKHAFESRKAHFENFSREYEESSKLLISNYENLVEIVNQWEKIQFKSVKKIV
jgi:hypothetical protein